MENLVHLYKLLRTLPASPAVRALKGILIVAAMIAIPFVAGPVLYKRGGLSPSGYIWAIAALILLAAILIAIAIYWYWEVSDRLDFIASCLNRAERDLNALLASGLEHGGRKSKVAERKDWSRLARPADIQIFETGYRTPAHDIIQWNENDLAGKGTVMGKATVTALLFRELYEGSVGTAQSRIKAEVKNNGGNLPYLAPGIRELVGIDKFKDGEFEEGAGVDSDELEWVVKHRKFPTQNLVSVKTNAEGVRKELRGKHVLEDLTQQKL